MVGWTGLINTILIEEIMGITVHHNTLLISPSIPSGWNSTTLNYSNPRFRVDFIIDSSSEITIDVVLKDNSLQYNSS
jgi:cellobiose phosphorylase